MKTYEPMTGDYVCYVDSQLTIIQAGPMEFDVYDTRTLEHLDTFEDSKVLLESTPEGCAQYWALGYYGLEDLDDLED